MTKQVSKTAIGGFMVSAIVLLVVGVMLFGSGEFFQKTFKFVLFFEGSVKGLTIGAPVLFRGVEVGSVEQIVIRPDTQTMTVQIPVVISINYENIDLEKRGDIQKTMPELIKRGFKARLAMESMVTGQLMIELDFHPDKPVRLTDTDLKYLQIPTIPTAFQQLGQTLKKVPIEEIVEKLMSTIESINKVLTAPELMDTVRSLNLAASNANTLIKNTDKLVLNVDRQVSPLTNDARALLQNVDSRIQPVSDLLKRTLEPAQSVLEQAEKTLVTYDGLAGEHSELRYKLNVLLEETAVAARSLRALTDYLEQHPEALLRGKGGNGGN